MSRKVYLVGMGCGSMTKAAEEKVKAAEVIIGSERMLKAASNEGARRIASCRTEEIFDKINECTEDNIAVLYSGDVGFYSGAPALYEKLKASDIEAELIPGVSVLSYFASKLGMIWHDMGIVSLHGADADIAGEAAAQEKTFFITSGGDDPERIGRTLAEAGYGKYKVTVGEWLGSEDERISSYKADELEGLTFGSINVVLTEQA